MCALEWQNNALCTLVCLVHFDHLGHYSAILMHTLKDLEPVKCVQSAWSSLLYSELPLIRTPEMWPPLAIAYMLSFKHQPAQNLSSLNRCVIECDILNDRNFPSWFNTDGISRNSTS